MRIFVFPPFFFLVAYICVRKAGNLDHPHTLLSRETIVIKLDVSFQKKKKKDGHLCCSFLCWLLRLCPDYVCVFSRLQCRTSGSRRLGLWPMRLR